MTFTDKVLYHEIHPAKLGVDVARFTLATYLFWQHRFLLGLAAVLVPAVLAAALIIVFADLERLRQSAFGRYFGRVMTRPVRAWGFAGMVIAWAAAWYHQPWLIVAGVLITLAAWFSGRWLRRRTSPNPCESKLTKD